MEYIQAAFCSLAKKYFKAGSRDLVVVLNVLCVQLLRNFMFVVRIIITIIHHPFFMHDCSTPSKYRLVLCKVLSPQNPSESAGVV